MHGTVSEFADVRSKVANGALSPKNLTEHFASVNGTSQQRSVGAELGKVWSVLKNPSTSWAVRQEYHDVLLGRFPVYSMEQDGSAKLQYVRQPYAPYAFLERHLVHYRDAILGDGNPAFAGLNDKAALLEMREQVAVALEMLNAGKYPGPVAARNAAFAIELEKIRVKPRNTDATPNPELLARFAPKPA